MDVDDALANVDDSVKEHLNRDHIVSLISRLLKSILMHNFP